MNIQNGKRFLCSLAQKDILAEASLVLLFFVLVSPTFGTVLQRLGVVVPHFLLGQGAYACVTLASILSLIAYALRKTIDLFCGSVIALCSVILVSTAYNGGNLYIILTDWFPCAAVVLLVALQGKKRAKSVVRSFFIVCVIYLLMNFAYLLADPGLIRFDSVRDYPFGYRNVTFRVAIPAFACSLVLDAIDRISLSARTVTVFLLSMLELLVGYSATSVCAFVLMGMLTVAVKEWGCPRALNAASYVGGFIALNIGVVVLRVQNILGFIIGPILHRSVTFTGRTELWDAAFSRLSNLHFFYGYGTGYMWNALALGDAPQKHAHNDVLHALMLGGVGALVSLALTVVLSARRLFEWRRTVVAASLSIGLAGFLLVSAVEVAACPGFFFLLAVAYYFPYDSVENEEDQKPLSLLMGERVRRIAAWASRMRGDNL